MINEVTLKNKDDDTIYVSKDYEKNVSFRVYQREGDNHELTKFDFKLDKKTAKELAIALLSMTNAK